MREGESNMKKATALVVVLMFAVATWSYQASSGASTKASTPAKTSTASTTKSTAKSTASGASAKESTITGCLSGPIGEGYYELKNASNRIGMQVNAMEGLKAHVGHKVKLTGTWEEEIPEVQERRFKVSKVDMIAATCTIPDAAKKTSTAKPAAPKTQ
jgi:uncharacterized protein YdeI (BOF family)